MPNESRFGDEIIVYRLGRRSSTMSVSFTGSICSGVHAMHFVSEDGAPARRCSRAHAIVGRITGERLINPPLP